MIKENELAIGRLFYHDGNVAEVKGYIQESDSLGTVIVYVESLSIPNERRKPINLEKLSPISLTPEWLERCGFERMNAGWINNSGSLSFYDKSQDVNGYYKMEYGTRNYNARLLFVHQLQNLYFVLVGEELTIKE